MLAIQPAGDNGSDKLHGGPKFSDMQWLEVTSCLRIESLNTVQVNYR